MTQPSGWAVDGEGRGRRLIGRYTASLKEGDLVSVRLCEDVTEGGTTR